MQETFRVKTRKSQEVVDITRPVAEAVARSRRDEGICTVFVRHANGRGRNVVDELVERARPDDRRCDAGLRRVPREGELRRRATFLFREGHEPLDHVERCRRRGSAEVIFAAVPTARRALIVTLILAGE